MKKKKQSQKDPKQTDIPLGDMEVTQDLIPPEDILQEKLLQEQLLRQMAEFDNYKKRTAKEKDELFGRAKAETAAGMLAVLDNFERALQTSCSDETFAQGIEMIFTQLVAALEKLGVEEIEAEGAAFDPDLHHAVQQIEDDAHASNTVASVLQKGYRLGDRVIRHAMVVVANP